MGLKNVTKSETKTTLETKSTKHVENVLNLIPLDLQETRFRMDLLQTSTKIRGADKYKKYQKYLDVKLKSLKKSVPELNKKQCLKTEPNK